MKEKQLINIIKNTLKSQYIGDDCAYLKDLDIVITQDSLVEDVHFSRPLITPFQLGYKSVMVNISDVCASGADPKYLTLSLSLPTDIQPEYVEEFYKGCKTACKEAQIVGGDITGSDKIFISVAAVGTTKGRKISSRSNAKVGQKIIVSGNHGSSGAGLMALLNLENQSSDLLNKINCSQAIREKFIKIHLMPQAQCEFSKQIAANIKEDYAMMDTSDGLMDALSTIADESNVVLSVDFDKIPYDKDLGEMVAISQEISTDNLIKDLIFYGGEDYQIVATVPMELLKDLDNYTIIGEVKTSLTGVDAGVENGAGVEIRTGAGIVAGAERGAGVEINYSAKKENKSEFYQKKDVEDKLYKHFKE